MAGLSLCARSMVVFNFLPSMTLHPTRKADDLSALYASALEAMPRSAPLWHRHWSRAILRREGLLDAPVTDLGTDALPVAMLQGRALTMLVRRIGVALCAPRLRYAISGDAVRALQATLGEDALRWLRDARGLHPGLSGPMFRDAQDALDHVSLAGHAALYAAFQDVRPEVARRLLLKLPVLPGLADARPPAAEERAPIDFVHEVGQALEAGKAMGLVMAAYAGLAGLAGLAGRADDAQYAVARQVGQLSDEAHA